MCLKQLLNLFTSFNGGLYLVAYLVSGIPFGYLLAKYVAGWILPRRNGNIGATNGTTFLKRDEKLAKKLGAITLLLDALKGAIIILIAKFLGASYDTLWTLAVLSVLGTAIAHF